ncbi:MAG: hypothetical protein ACI8XO_003196 [Verrucomicrobiales bacterium]|jgi:hypothetical protein
MTEMTTRTLTTIALRFFALIWTLKSVALLAAVISSLRHHAHFAIPPIEWIFRILPIFIGIGFWVLSGTIARLICFRCDTPIPTAEIGEFALYRAIFLAAGLWALLTSAGDLATWLHYYTEVQRTGVEQIVSTDLYEMGRLAVTFALGLILVLSSHVWARKACRAGNTTTLQP